MRTSKTLLSSSFLCGAALWLLQSCSGAGSQSDFQELPESGWPLRTPVRFSLTVKDSLSDQSLWIALRHDQDYPFSNIFLITTLSHPNGSVITDTLSYDLAASDGQWLGSGNGIITHQLPFKKGVRFDSAKPYELSIYQAVRSLGSQEGMVFLPGVLSVGYLLEKSTSNPK
jgi:gliding motility-associated lipoprotein GldH